MHNSDTLLTALKNARQTHQLYMVYQPILNLHTRRICGFEALMRWNSSQWGMVSPELFITLLETSGHFLSVEEMVIKTPWETAASWHEALSLSVNFSALELCQPDLPQRVKQNLATFGVDPHRCEIEVTETQPMQNCQIAVNNMIALKALGIRFSLDDFGTGHANLDYLLKYPFDTIKIDKAFIVENEPGSKSAKIVEGIITLAHNFGIDVLAEGVENPAQLERLCSLGCDKAQGFYISPPVLPEDIPCLLAHAF